MRIFDRSFGLWLDPVLLAFMLHLMLSGCGQKQAYDTGTELEDAVLGGGGASRTSVDPTVVTTDRIVTVKTAPPLNIVNVTQIIPATSGLPDFTAAMLPFTGTPVGIGAPVLNAQTAFHFNFSFPQNNYQFVEAHLVIDTARDNSDTEAIFVDGVFTGRPPLANVNNSSSEVTHKLYAGNGGSVTNQHFIDYSLAHYKVATENSFDLLLSDLLEGSNKTSIDVLKDNRLNVVTGDDSQVNQAFLVIRGRTISDSSLQCAQSPEFSFINRYVHSDGNTIGAAAFSGATANARESWQGSIGTYQAIEFYFDAPLPKVDVSQINIDKANVMMTVKRNNSAKVALIVNGVGISETGFDRSTASSAVERWIDAGTATLDSFLATVPATEATVPMNLNLNSLYGAAEVRSMLAQGKLNISLAGSQIVSASGLSSARAPGVQVSGPELELEGRYSTEVCEVPDNPDSLLTQEGVRVVEPETEVTEGSSQVLNDGAGPVIGSLQSSEISSTKATILWTTDEPSTSLVQYGVGNTSLSAQSSTLTTYHQIELSGLSPYKYYDFKVTSIDKFGNASTSNVSVFVTLR